MKILFYIISIIGFFFPYVLKFLIASPNESIKIFSIYCLGKFNLIYFALVIIIFFAGLTKKYSNIAQIAQIIFIPVYIGFVLVNYFVLAKMDVQNYIKKHHLNARMVKVTDLKKYPNFKIYYRKANFAAVKILPKAKNTLPFNYKKDRGQE